MKVDPYSLAVTQLMVNLDALGWEVFIGHNDADERLVREDLANALNQESAKAAQILLECGGWTFGVSGAAEFASAWGEAMKNRLVEPAYAENIANIALVLAVTSRDYKEARKIITILEHLNAA